MNFSQLKDKAKAKYEKLFLPAIRPQDPLVNHQCSSLSYNYPPITLSTWVEWDT